MFHAYAALYPIPFYLDTLSLGVLSLPGHNNQCPVSIITMRCAGPENTVRAVPEYTQALVYSSTATITSHFVQATFPSPDGMDAAVHLVPCSCVVLFPIPRTALDLPVAVSRTRLCNPTAQRLLSL